MPQSLVLQLWLAYRQVRYVGAHRLAVPAHFTARITPDAHRKAADYTIARTRFSVVDTLLDAALLFILTLGGGVAAIAVSLETLELSSLWRDVALVLSVAVLCGAATLPPDRQCRTLPAGGRDPCAAHGRPYARDFSYVLAIFP